ncbi:hypothetical protein BK712_07375 [Bacillus thuringiensis serovar seoulensis]|nr:hypothetical protein BK712_07375 [Bacillus thuringiensis serovar seoulensis]
MKMVLKITNLVHNIYFYKFKKIKFRYFSTLHNYVEYLDILEWETHYKILKKINYNKVILFVIVNLSVRVGKE